VSENRIEHGIRAELALRRRLLDGGARPLGWKVTFNIPAVQELLGIDRPLAGLLTTDGLAQGGGTWATHGEPLVAEPEVAVEIGADGLNGELRAEVGADSTGAHLEPMVEVIAGRLSDAGEELRPGDRIITGVIAPPTPAEDGDTCGSSSKGSERLSSRSGRYSDPHAPG
jgi:2-keto-4-pentenoate hydratase